MPKRHEDGRFERMLAACPRFSACLRPAIPFMPAIGLPTACAAMGALVLALVIWRADVVRLLPQTATVLQDWSGWT